jgi:hypothetical protein
MLGSSESMVAMQDDFDCTGMDDSSALATPNLIIVIIERM